MIPKHFKSVTSPEMPTVYIVNNNEEVESFDVSIYEDPDDIFLNLTYTNGDTDAITLLPVTSAEDWDEKKTLDTFQIIKSEDAADIVVFLLWPN
jgi:hypothetical protein